MIKKEPLFSFVIPALVSALSGISRESFRLVRNRKERLRTSRNDRKRINVALLMTLIVKNYKELKVWQRSYLQLNWRRTSHE
jgi:hypothetical protein